MEKCANFFVYADPLAKVERPLRSFADNLELTLDTLTNKNSFLIVTIGDLMQKQLTNWYENDTKSYEGLKVMQLLPNLVYNA